MKTLSLLCILGVATAVQIEDSGRDYPCRDEELTALAVCGDNPCADLGNHPCATSSDPATCDWSDWPALTACQAGAAAFDACVGGVYADPPAEL